MDASRTDTSWSEPTTYACACGALFIALRWRLVDVEARPDLAAKIAVEGPYEGSCTECGRVASGLGAWVAIEPTRREADVVIPSDHRGELINALIEHLELLRQRPELVEPWLLRPTWRFADLSSELESGISTEFELPSSAELNLEVSNELELEGESGTALDAEPAPVSGIPHDEDGSTTPPSGLPLPAARRSSELPPPPPFDDVGVPVAVGEPWSRKASRASAENDVVVTDLGLEEGLVTAEARLATPQRRLWGTAAIQLRPMLIRDHGYPLVGVRLVASYLGEVGLIDAVLDVAKPTSNDVFLALAEHCRLQLVLVDPEDASATTRRHIEADGLERNAALCIESARAMLTSGEFPADAFTRARDQLIREPASKRLRPAENSLAVGSYRHLVGTAETLVALAHLDEASRPENLAHLLEVEGLRVSEYEDIRKRVLQASIEHGLCAPRRFWRRILSSNLAKDSHAYVAKLVSARAAAEGSGNDDLTPEQRKSAWLAIYELCRRKDVPPPAEVCEALNLDELNQPGPEPERRSAAASGELGKKSGSIGEDRPAGSDLEDPERRLRAALALLRGKIGFAQLQAVLDAIERFDTEELLAIMPSLAELGPRAVPGLVSKLASHRREIRQAAAILLGMARDNDAMESLLAHLIREPTSVWVEVARAVGQYGTRALSALSVMLQTVAADDRGAQERTIVRVARAMAEIAINDGAQGQAAIELISTDPDPTVATAGRHALATLHDVSVAGAQIRGEQPLGEVTEVGGFSRRAYEAITVPELDLVEDLREVEAEGG